MMCDTPERVYEWERAWTEERGRVPVEMARRAAAVPEIMSLSRDVWEAWQDVLTRAEAAHVVREQEQREWEQQKAKEREAQEAAMLTRVKAQGATKPECATCNGSGEEYLGESAGNVHTCRVCKGSGQSPAE